MADYAGSGTQTLAAATAAQVFPDRHGKRISFAIANTGANAAYVNMSNQESATAGSGIYLAAGGILTDSNAGNYLCWQGSIAAVSTAGSTLALWERVSL